MRFLFLIASMVGLGACAQVNGDIAADATSAAAVAQAIGRTQDIPCFSAISAMASAAKNVKPPAILTTTELALGGQQLAEGPCSPIIGAVALTVLQHQPILVTVP